MGVQVDKGVSKDIWLMGVCFNQGVEVLVMRRKQAEERVEKAGIGNR